jgi:hypothetical protein
MLRRRTSSSTCRVRRVLSIPRPRGWISRVASRSLFATVWLAAHPEADGSRCAAADPDVRRGIELDRLIKLPDTLAGLHYESAEDFLRIAGEDGHQWEVVPSFVQVTASRAAGGVREELHGVRWHKVGTLQLDPIRAFIRATMKSHRPRLLRKQRVAPAAKTGTRANPGSDERHCEGYVMS